MSDLKKVLAERLKEMRERAQLSQADLAAVIGSSNYQISRYEAGVIAPSAENLVALANALNCSTDFLLGRAEVPQIGAWQEGEISADEFSLITLIRENDTPRVLQVLSTLVEEAELRHHESYRRSGGPMSLASQPVKVRNRKRRSPNTAPIRRLDETDGPTDIPF